MLCANLFDWSTSTALRGRCNLKRNTAALLRSAAICLAFDLRISSRRCQLLHGMASVLTESNNENVPEAGLLKKQKMQSTKDTLQVMCQHDFAVLPKRGSSKAAGYDLSSCEDCVIPARGRAVVNTGLIIATPPGTYARVAPRSGLAVKHFIDTGAGVIDEDYRGEVGVVLFNHGETDFKVKREDRIAQLILECIVTPEVEEVSLLDSTVRGKGGFGSTGFGR